MLYPESRSSMGDQCSEWGQESQLDWKDNSFDGAVAGIFVENFITPTCIKVQKDKQGEATIAGR